MIKEINEKTFEQEVASSDKVVVADFWAAWCGPCKMLGPVIEEVSNDMEGKAKFVKINVDESPALAQKYGIASIPTVVVFENGEVKDTMVGFRPKQDIVKIIESNL